MCQSTPKSSNPLQTLSTLSTLSTRQLTLTPLPSTPPPPPPNQFNQFNQFNQSNLIRSDLLSRTQPSFSPDECIQTSTTNSPIPNPVVSLIPCNPSPSPPFPFPFSTSSVFSIVSETSSSPHPRTSPNRQLFKGSDNPIENLGPAYHHSHSRDLNSPPPGKPLLRRCELDRSNQRRPSRIRA